MTAEAEAAAGRSDWRVAQHEKRNSLALFGIEYVAACGDWVPIGTGMADMQWRHDAPYSPICLVREYAATVFSGCETRRWGLAAA